MTEIATVVIATRHEAKLAELVAALAHPWIRFVPLSELGVELASPSDDATTLEAVAVEKARGACLTTGLIALAEESGLEVDALGGRPGVRSARFANERATDAENNAALLRQLEDISEADRSAHLRCVLALAVPWEETPVTTEGRCDGYIARAPRGSGGFGYEPLLVVDRQRDRALAELDQADRDAHSPRKRAARALVPILDRLVRSLVEDAERILT